MESVSEDEVHNLDKVKRERGAPPVDVAPTEAPAAVRLKEEPRVKEEREEPRIKEEARVKEEVVEATLNMDVEEFEPILSDEEIVDDSENYQEMDYDYSTYTNNDDLIKLFVPGVTEVQKYKKREDVVISENEFYVSETLRTTIAIADDFFKSSITKYTLENFEKFNAEIKEEFIHLCEKTTSIFGDVDSFRAICRIYAKLDDANAETDRELATQVQLIVETLVEWLKIALNYSLANAQEQPGYKIRHIKCGVRLSEWCSNSVDFLQLLWKQKGFTIHAVLLELYEQEYMALSIKLMILRALDTYLLKKPAIECFLRGSVENSEDTIQENGFVPLAEKNGYKILVQLMRKHPSSVRLKFALNSILKKLNFYEVLCKLSAALSKLRGDKSSTPAELNLIIKSLDQILHTLQSGPFVVSQPKRFLPVAAQFEIARTDVRNVLTSFLEMHNALQCFALLLTLPHTMNVPAIKTPIYEILNVMTSDFEGLRYLSENSETVNVILKCLVQTDEDIAAFLPESIENKSHNLGLSMAYMLQCLYHVENLLDLGGKSKFDCGAPEVIDELHAMFCLTFSGIGKFAVARVLGMKDNVRCLLQFLDVLNCKEKSENQVQRLKKSPAIGYIVDLVSFTVTCVANVGFLETHSKQLLNIVNHREVFEASVGEKLNELYAFLKPFESLNSINYDNISPFVEQITKNLDNVTNYPGQLITSLRIIEFLGISGNSNKTPILSENPLSSYVELKYKHVILQLFSADGVSLLTKILQKICDHYEQPTLHSSVFASNLSIQIMSVIHPCIELLKQMLTYLIQCRNTQFRDLTSIPVLLQTYNLLRAFPATSCVYFKAQKACQAIIDTLLVYTQPVSDEVHEKDSLTKTLWTLMCGEVIKYVTTAPYTFMSGLMIFSELLPLPLPIQTRNELTKDEISWAINLRKLWSAHLHTHGGSVQELINRMCITSHQPLLNLLRRVCVQLSDLAANTAIMIARGILDTVHNALNADNMPCGGNVARLLNFLACLVTHSPLKCAVLQLIHNNSATALKGDEKYPSLINSFSLILKTSNSSNSHVQAQECILSIFQSFCDSEITLLQTSVEENAELTSDVYLANALPMKDHFVLFINTMIEHLIENNTFVTYLPIARSLLLLTEHNYGFYHLRDCLNRKSEPFLTVFNKLMENFSKDSAECLSTLNTLVEFLRVCGATEEVDAQLLYTPRNMKMTLAEIRASVGWKNDEEENKKHPLHLLEDLLKVSVISLHYFHSKTNTLL